MYQKHLESVYSAVKPIKHKYDDNTALHDAEERYRTFEAHRGDVHRFVKVIHWVRGSTVHLHPGHWNGFVRSGILGTILPDDLTPTTTNWPQLERWCRSDAIDPVMYIETEWCDGRGFASPTVDLDEVSDVFARLRGQEAWEINHRLGLYGAAMDIGHAGTYRSNTVNAWDGDNNRAGILQSAAADPALTERLLGLRAETDATLNHPKYRSAIDRHARYMSHRDTGFNNFMRLAGNLVLIDFEHTRIDNPLSDYAQLARHAYLHGQPEEASRIRDRALQDCSVICGTDTPLLWTACVLEKATAYIGHVLEKHGVEKRGARAGTAVEFAFELMKVM